jgi:hypothetical protein
MSRMAPKDLGCEAGTFYGGTWGLKPSALKHDHANPVKARADGGLC